MSSPLMYDNTEPTDIKSFDLSTYPFDDETVANILTNERDSSFSFIRNFSDIKTEISDIALLPTSIQGFVDLPYCGASDRIESRRVSLISESSRSLPDDDTYMPREDLINSTASPWDSPITVKIEDIVSVTTPDNTEQSVSSTTRSSGQRGHQSTSSSTDGARRVSKRRILEKGSEEYVEKRSRNNVAVRKSRDKAKVHQRTTETRVLDLTRENEALQTKVDLLSKELTVLKGLFVNVGAALPDDFEKLFQS